MVTSAATIRLPFEGELGARAGAVVVEGDVGAAAPAGLAHAEAVGARGPVQARHAGVVGPAPARGLDRDLGGRTGVDHAQRDVAALRVMEREARGLQRVRAPARQGDLRELAARQVEAHPVAVAAAADTAVERLAEPHARVGPRGGRGVAGLAPHRGGAEAARDLPELEPRDRAPLAQRGAREVAARARERTHVVGQRVAGLRVERARRAGVPVVGQQLGADGRGREALRRRARRGDLDRLQVGLQRSVVALEGPGAQLGADRAHVGSSS